MFDDIVGGKTPKEVEDDVVTLFMGGDSIFYLSRQIGPHGPIITFVCDDRVNQPDFSQLKADIEQMIASWGIK